MGPFNGPALVLAVFLCLKTSYAYTEAVAANLPMGKFEPEVAFKCNRPPMHRVVNGWEADLKVNVNSTCPDQLSYILSYCKEVYPDHQITNVIERDYKIEIPNWPGMDGAVLKAEEVTPYQCLVGDFESKALLVPQHCIFDHEHDSNRCERPSKWIETAREKCNSQGMELESSGMLVVCGTDTFRGVEYVCCPRDEEDSDNSSETDSVHSSQNASEEEEEDDYRAYLRGNDMNKYDNEHIKFRAAERAMQKHQHEKVTKMMKEWQKARDNVASLRKSDKKGAEQLNKEITERFQRMYHAYEQEGQSEKKQLVSLHQQRVQAMFNRRKRTLMEEFKQELEDDEPRAAKVLSSLQQYIRVEEKDRLHTVNHYEHLRDTDPEEALRIRDSCVNHLNLITKRIEDTIDMLKRVPELDEKIRPQIAEFRNKKFRSLEISMDEVIMKPVVAPVKEEAVEVMPVDMLVDSSSEDSKEHDYTNIKIDSEGMAIDVNQPYIANVQNDAAHVQQASFTENHSAVPFTNAVGMAIGSVAVFIIVVVAIVMLRKRSRRQPITHGFVEVDPAASPEERHVANMQMNGYENPTYRYFEMGTK